MWASEERTASTDASAAHVAAALDENIETKQQHWEGLAELGPGEGIELSAVGYYTLNKANCRGEWLTQWLLENKLVALNTMYRKLRQKQVTYHTPKRVEKQLDYILTDKKHYSGSRDAEANDTIHMGSDHRCVMAKFVIPKEKA